MNIKQTLAATALALATLVPAVANAHPDYRGPSHGRTVVREYSYVYYPERQVYYAPRNRNWYWQDRGHWRSGAYLPRAYAGLSVGGINIVLDADRPYARHTYVVERYGHRPPPRHYREYRRDDRRDRHDHHDRHDHDRRYDRY